MPQHLDALFMANNYRFKQTELKKKVKNKEMGLRELILDPPVELRNYKVFDAIMWQDRWGRERTRRLFIKLGLSEWITFGSMTDRQRHILAPRIP